MKITFTDKEIELMYLFINKHCCANDPPFLICSIYKLEEFLECENSINCYDFITKVIKLYEESGKNKTIEIEDKYDN